MKIGSVNGFLSISGPIFLLFFSIFVSFDPWDTPLNHSGKLVIGKKTCLNWLTAIPKLTNPVWASPIIGGSWIFGRDNEVCLLKKSLIDGLVVYVHGTKDWSLKLSQSGEAFTSRSFSKNGIDQGPFHNNQVVLHKFVYSLIFSPQPWWSSCFPPCIVELMEICVKPFSGRITTFHTNGTSSYL